jgi:TldD protein
MNRRQFIEYSGVGAAALFAGPSLGRVVAAQNNTAPIPASEKKKLADVALNAATKRGATYVDVRIGRYFQQFVITRETRVQNLVNTESFGAGVRVIADGCWGFMATDQLTPDAIAKAAVEAVAIAKANAKLQTEPVILAPQKGVGEVSWRTPIEKNAFEIPIAEKIALLMEVNQAALKNGANFVNSQMFAANQQKYFASTDGSYIDQDVHRIWPTFTVTAIDPKSGKFQTRRSISAPCGRGYEYLDAKPSGKLAGVTTRYTTSYDMIEDVIASAGSRSRSFSFRTSSDCTVCALLAPSE